MSLDRKIPVRLLKKYIKKRDTVVELFYGDVTDLVFVLATLVGPEGRVYAIDALPIDRLVQWRTSIYHLEKEKLGYDNVTFIQAKIPPLPREVQAVNSFVAREFLWAYMGKKDQQIFVFHQLNY